MDCQKEQKLLTSSYSWRKKFTAAVHVVTVAASTGGATGATSMHEHAVARALALKAGSGDFCIDLRE